MQSQSQQCTCHPQSLPNRNAGCPVHGVTDYHFACTSCGQARGGRHWSTCAYANLTSHYVVDSQCHRVNSPS